MITNEELRKVMTYGTKYREPVNQSPEELLVTLETGLEDFVKKIAKRYKVRAGGLTEWKDKVIQVFKNKIDFFVRNRPILFEKTTPVLEKDEVKSYLKEISRHFIISTIDKAANNYVFICKKFYLITLMKELGVDLGTFECVGNNTYSPINISEEELIEQHCCYIKDTFDITVTRANRCIPRIFWTPKLHKTPYKARFIAGASKCTTKQLSVLVNKALKVLKEYFTKYCQTIYRNSGINCDWSINSSSQFLEKLPRVDLYNLQIYDFTTLYTNLNLNVVETLLFEVIDLLFNNTNKYICVSKFKDNYFFSKKEYNGYICFSAEKLKEAISFILKNTYVCFGGFILKQTKGIPMGGNSSSQIADVSLCKSEFNFMISLIKEKKFNLAKLLSNNCRYVDDLIILNYLHFENLIAKIYPSDLKMERSGNDNKNVNYLDVNISITNNGGISTDLYNKLDDFNFPVVMFTFPHGNMPISVGYNVFYSQILRYSNIISHLEPFLFAVNNIYKILIRRAYDDIKLKKKFKELMGSRPEILLKYNVGDLKDIEEKAFQI